MSHTTVETANLEAQRITTTPLAEVHGERLPHFLETPFPRLFEQQAGVQPGAIALLCEDEQLTFRELNARANQLARHLQKLGVGTESIVGICIDRSVEMAIAIIATLKAGAAYLPLDPEYPQERLAFMLKDASPTVVLTKSRLAAKLRFSTSPIGGGATRWLALDEDWTRIAQNSGENLASAPARDDLAYVIYTSGSTGQPKGAMITHSGLANYLRALNRELEIDSHDLYLHTASIAFSSARRQLLLPLSHGAGVAIATSDQRKDPIALFRMLKSRGVTVMDAVPSFWRSCTTILNALPERDRRDLLDNPVRLMLSASEPLSSEIPLTWMNEFNHPAQHVHMFGQTETAGIVALFRIPRDFDGDKFVPVGGPIANTDIYVLDENQQPCGIDESGELYIAGAGVGRGYLNRPELTDEKFIEREGMRLYRTGDWARVSADGRLEFAGRRDQQIKLRGFRVELGEIESALARHPSVRECVVVAREPGAGNGDKRLIAYFVPQAPTVSAADLRAFLSARIADYQVPATFVELAALPLSANGKVDRLRLPEVEMSRNGVSSAYVAPQNEIETRLAKIWSEILSLESIGRHDNFFELGGHSLLAAQIAARLRSHFGFETPITTVFEFPTIKLLAERIASGGGDPVRTIAKVTRSEDIPLSFNQQQFWLLEQVSPNRATYNVSTGLQIDGALDVEKLQRAIDRIVERHQTLRTNIVTTNDSAAQIISPAVSIPVRMTDLSMLQDEQVISQRAAIFNEERNHVFDLGNGPLMRVRLLKFTDQRHELLFTLHHIICDGWSINVLLRELTQLYLTNLDTAVLPQLSIQYADFAVWQRRWIEDEATERQLKYWQQQLADAPSALDLPTDYERPAVRIYEAGCVSAKLPDQLTESLKALSRQQNVTLFTTLLAAFQTLLFRYSGQDDVVVGTPVAGRTIIECENLIGAFVNTVALRGDLSGSPAFQDVLARVRQTVLDAFCHQDLPFATVVEALNPERSANRSPIFQVMFSFQNVPAPELTDHGSKFTTMQVANNVAKFDLTLEVAESANGLAISFEYAKDLFAAGTVNRMLGHLLNLLTAVVNDPAQPIVDIELLTFAEREELLIEWNRNQLALPQVTGIHQLFEAQAAETPDAAALEFRGQQLTYRELNARANQLAHNLIKRGIGAEAMVAVHIERSFEMIVAILAVLKTGAAYVPLDPTYPRERIAFMIQDTAARVVISQSHLSPNIDAGIELINLDEEINATECVADPAVQVSSSQVALVLYTSGSTGNPKGVMLEHRSLVNFASAAKSTYAINGADRILQFGSLSFDLSLEEMLISLTTGACLVLRTAEMISTPKEFLARCEEWRLSVLDLPTVYWHELTDALIKQGLTLPRSIRSVIIGGEKASSDRVAAWQRIVGNKVRLLNSYGPTETTIAVTWCDLSAHPPAALEKCTPIGRPYPNAKAYVLDAQLRPVPIGIHGELHIGGPGVARGYLNRADLTSQKFIANPFSDDPSDRLYKTGDVVRYHDDGNLEFVGRSDNQIKIRGFRVELEEIERVIRSHEAVANCVVIAAGGDDKRLVAYLITNDNSRAAIPGLRSFLKTKLPSYMVPAAFELVAEFPLASSGKINRRALPEPQFNRAAVDATIDLPTTPLEQMLLAAWQEVLKVDVIGAHENFFDLGGHSLLASRLVAHVRNTLDVEFNMVEVFEAPTISALAEMLYPRIAQRESDADLAKLIEELSALSDEEAQLRLESELGLQPAVA